MSTDLFRSRFARIVFSGALFALLLTQAVSAEMRMWQKTDGTRIEAEYDRQFLGTVCLTGRDQKRILVELDELSEKDRVYLRTSVPPEIKVSFSKSSRNKDRSIYARPDDVIDVITGVLEVRKTSRLPFEGTLRAELYMVADEVATSHHSLILKDVIQVAFNDPENGVFQAERSVEVRRYLEYNNEYRGAKYAGYLIVVFGPQGNRIETLTNLSWLDESEVDSLRDLTKGSFFNDSCRRSSVPRPKYYTTRYLY